SPYTLIITCIFFIFFVHSLLVAQKEQPSVGSLPDQLNFIAQRAMEANVVEMSMNEIRSLEETVTSALAAIRVV
ncbi:unnamed protein product, partial [Urochloa humidicola]